MASGSFRFDRFVLDCRDRKLTFDDVPVELNSRYLDALALLVRESGSLVSKDRFMDEVWRGVPVTDEALTQCIKTLRGRLGDSVGNPRFIETVPKHGYRFVAAVAPVETARASDVSRAGASTAWQQILLLGGAGTLGGGIAGLIGGMIYGFIGASQPGPGVAAISILLVLMCVTIVIAMLGAAGVAFGIAIAGAIAKHAWRWSVAGGAAGGLVIGALVKLLGLDAFVLLLGQSPGDITGAAEGTVLGAAVGVGGWLAWRLGARSLRRSVAISALTGGAAGALIPLFGGRMMAGSLDLLARHLPGSRLRLDAVGALFGEAGLGPVSQVVTGALEGSLFAGCVVGAMLLARRG